MEKQYYVYILASHKNGTLYTGFTAGLLARTWSHKNDIVEGFTKKYQVHRLVYYQVFEDRDAALKYEKQLKKWRRQWKLRLIETMNPDWKDLYKDIA
jgi:putative endonuclease